MSRFTSRDISPFFLRKKWWLSQALAALIVFSAASASLAEGETVLACGATSADAQLIFSLSVSTLYNMFPIKIGETTIIAGGEDTPSGNVSPVCYCPIPIPPYYRMGIVVSFWEPIALLEAVALPGCSPALGQTLPVGSTGAFSIGGHTSHEPTHPGESLQFHWITNPVYYMLNDTANTHCVTKGSGLDLAYLTEYDPLWQNDSWAMQIHPEVLLFANPLAQFACMADAIASAAGFPLTPLFWCAGSWGSVYPFSKNASLDHPSSSALITARAIYKMHRETILWGSTGVNVAMCAQHPMPIWLKHQYGIFPLYPVLWPYRIPIGRTGMIWSAGEDAPGISKHVDVWAIYRKRTCCVSW